MKKLLLSLMMLGVTSVLAVGATTSYFSDTEISSGNTIVAGTLDLVLDTEGEASLPISLTNIVPGATGSRSATLTNIGTLPGMLNIDLQNIIDDENGLLEPEINPGYGTPDYEGNGGELDLFFGFAAYLDINKNNVFDAGDIQLTYDSQKRVYPGFWGGDFNYSGLYAMEHPWNNVMQLNPGQSVNFVIMWQMPTESTDRNYSQNIAMSDKLGFDIEFLLQQN